MSELETAAFHDRRSAERRLRRIHSLKSVLKSREASSDAEIRLSLRKERGRRLRAQAQGKELKLAQAQGNLISISDWQHALNGKILTVRQNLLNLPRRIARELEYEDCQAVAARLRRELKRAASLLGRRMGQVE